MKPLRHPVPLLFALLAATSVCLLPLRAADEPGKDKKSSEKARDVLEKLMDEAKKAAGKAKEESKSLWTHTKDLFKVDREEYTKKAEFAMKAMDAEIKALADSDAPVSGREYFKTRVESLRQQLDFCRKDLEKIKPLDEDAFRVKQKSFDRSLGWLGEHLANTKEEAGL